MLSYSDTETLEELLFSIFWNIKRTLLEKLIFLWSENSQVREYRFGQIWFLLIQANMKNIVAVIAHVFKNWDSRYSFHWTDFIDNAKRINLKDNST
jgi:hypothetical protein